MTEQRTEEIRARAVLMARRLVHAGQDNEVERKAIKLTLQREGLTDEEGNLFFDVYSKEALAARAAAAREDADWRSTGISIAAALSEEGELQVRDWRRPSVETAAKVRAALAAAEDWPRLTARRQAEVDALVVDAAIGELRYRAARRSLWDDLGTRIAESGDHGEADRAALAAAALAAGHAVAELLPTIRKQVRDLLSLLASDPRHVEVYSMRSSLQYRSCMRRRSSERKAALLAADALCRVARAAAYGDLATHVPAAWDLAGKALAAAYDGPALAERLEGLRRGVLAALPDSYRADLGVTAEECQLRSTAQAAA